MRPTLILFLLALAIGSLAPPAFSKCSKEDVDFYLEKGFTHEQITQLCAAASDASVPDYKPYQQQVIIYSDEAGPSARDGFTRKESKAIRDLEDGVDVIGLKVNQDAIQYTLKICLAVQEGKEYSQRFKTCPEVFHSIARSGLEIVVSGKKFMFFGQQAVRVKGNIQHKSKVNFDDYPIQFKKQLKRAYDWKANKDVAYLPIRHGYSLTKVLNALNTLAKPAEEGVTLAQDTSAEGVEMEDEDKPKKKRWWNPFD